MKTLFILALLLGAFIAGGIYALKSIGLIDEGCPAVSRSANQIVLDNRLPVDLRVRLHDATTHDLVLPAEECILVDINKLKVSVETWVSQGSAVPNCVANLLPAQSLSIYDRTGLVYCDVGRADLAD